MVRLELMISVAVLFYIRSACKLSLRWSKPLALESFPESGGDSFLLDFSEDLVSVEAEVNF